MSKAKSVENVQLPNIRQNSNKFTENESLNFKQVKSSGINKFNNSKFGDIIFETSSGRNKYNTP